MPTNEIQEHSTHSDVRRTAKNEFNYRRAWKGGANLTIASGVVTVTTSKIYSVLTEGAASTDNLDTINFDASVPTDMRDGMVIWIQAGDDGDDVVLTKSGNIDHPNTTITLAEVKDLVGLVWDAALSKWRVFANQGGATA